MGQWVLWTRRGALDLGRWPSKALARRPKLGAVGVPGSGKAEEGVVLLCLSCRGCRRAAARAGENARAGLRRYEMGAQVGCRAASVVRCPGEAVGSCQSLKGEQNMGLTF